MIGVDWRNQYGWEINDKYHGYIRKRYVVDDISENPPNRNIPRVH